MRKPLTMRYRLDRTTGVAHQVGPRPLHLRGGFQIGIVSGRTEPKGTGAGSADTEPSLTLGPFGWDEELIPPPKDQS